MNLKKTILIFLGYSLLSMPLTALAQLYFADDCDTTLMFKTPGETATVTCTWKKTASYKRLTLPIADWDPAVKSVTAVCNFIPATVSSDDNRVSKLVNVLGSVVKNLTIRENTATFNVMNVKYTIWSSQEIEFEVNSNEGFMSNFETAKFNPNDKITCTFALA